MPNPASQYTSTANEDLRIGTLTSFAQALLYYSTLVSQRFFPASPPRLFPVRLMMAYFPFIDTIFDNERRRLAWNELNAELNSHLTYDAGFSFPNMSLALVRECQSISPIKLEKQLHSAIKKNLTLSDLAYQDALLENDPLLKCFDEHVTWTGSPESIERSQHTARLLVAAEAEPWPDSPCKCQYVEHVASLLKCTTPLKRVDTKLTVSREYESTDLLGDSNISFLFMCLSSEADISSQLSELSEIKYDHKLVVLVIVLLGIQDRPTQYVKHQLPRGRMAVTIGTADILRHCMSKGDGYLPQHVLGQLPLSVVSPYRTVGAARKTFFGRESELETVIQSHDTNFAVLGPRKIGKTSLLVELASTFNGPNIQNAIAVPIDAGKDASLEGFVEQLYREFVGAVTVAQPDVLDWFEKGRQHRETYRQFAMDIDAVSEAGFSVVFLIDEIDGILESPDRKKFESFARSIANRRKARFIVFGYTTLAETLTDGMSAFFNLFERINLGPIDPKAAAQLATVPMAEMGISYDDESSPRKIVELCSRIPWLIQGLCEHIICRLGDSREISSARIVESYNSTEFTKLLLQNIREDRSVGNLQLLIVYVIARSDANRITEQDVYAQLKKLVFGVSYKTVQRSLLHLTSTYLLKNTEMGYRFFVEQQRRRLNEVEDVDATIAALAREIRDLSS